jgi:carbon monoxide dehydrogenase subunit G
MRFSSKQDVEAPMEPIFQVLTDFATWETAAMRRGVEVERKDKLLQPGAGMRWATKFAYRGKAREMEVELTQLDPPQSLRFAAVSQALEGVISMELIEQSPQRTRLHVVVDITPRSLTARLFLQSLRLARAKLDRKFDQRIAMLAGDIELRYRSLRRA